MGARNAFIGRYEELARLVEAVRQSRLVSLLGPGGVGKTRLVEELLARGVEAGLSEGDRWLCDLSDAEDQESICRAVARSLDVPLVHDAGIAESIEQLGHVLDARGEALLVLDNFEQLVEHAGATVARWLELTRALRIVVTSRERLHLTQERVVVLEPMSLPPHGEDAVALFEARARAAGASVGAEHDENITAIVRLLDGLPLAIELAAARARLISPPQLLSHLQDGFDALGRGPRDVAPRHQRMEACIAWSWDLLDAELQSALARCSLFLSDFSLEDAAAVIGAGALDALVELCDKSLIAVVEQDGDVSRYRLLTSVRAFAAQRLPDDDDARVRYWRHFGKLAKDWLEQMEARLFDTDPARLERSLRAQENLSAAAWAALCTDDVEGLDVAATITMTLAYVLARVGRLAPHLPRLDELTADARFADLSSAQRVRVLLCRAQLRRLCGRGEDAHEDVQRAQELADDPRSAARCRWIEGLVYASQGELTRAAETFVATLEAVREHDAPAAAGALLIDMAQIASRRHELAKGRELVDEALPISELGGARRDVGRALHVRGVASRGEAAVQDLRAALAVFREIGERRREAACHGHLAEAHQRLGRYQEAAASYEAAESMLADLGDRSSQAEMVAAAARMMHLRGGLEEALAGYRRATVMFENLGDRSEHARTASLVGAALADLGRVEAASEALERARAIADELGDDELSASIAIHAAHLDAARGDEAAARARQREGEDAVGRWPALEDALSLLEPVCPPAGALVVGPDTQWLTLPRGDRVDLSRNESLRSLVAGLVERRRLAPGQPIDRAGLFELGWPGDKALKKARGTRVRVALSTLRKMGLKELILSKDGGWLLDPAVPVVRAAPTVACS